MPARRTARHQASRRFRGLAVLWALPLAAALVAGGLYLSRSAGPAAPATGTRDAALAAGSCQPAATAPSTPGSHCAQPAPAAASSGTPGSGYPPAAHQHRAAAARRQHATATASRTPVPPTSRAPASPAPSSSGPAQGGQYGPAVTQVLALINQARAQAGLAAYTVSSGLVRSASGHTQVMAGGCGLSHQCPGEPALGARETDAGVQWTAAGENIGEAGPISGSSAAIAHAAVGLTQDMLNEKPPDDGHRLNILSSAFQHIGISVYRDKSGTLWLTQDFSN